MPSIPSNIGRALLPLSRTTTVLFAAYLLLASVGATAIAATHLGHGPAWGLAYALTLAVLLTPLLYQTTPKLLRNPTLWLLLLLAIATADQLHFAHARTKTDPLTSALALELPARALLHGREPYSVDLPGNAPISPGPGWILLLSPLSAPGLTGLLGMAALALTTLTLARQNRTAAGLFCLLMLLQPLFQSQAANGQDLYVMTLSLVTLTLLAGRHAANPKAIALLSLLAGLVATARMPMPAILLVLALGLFRRNRRAGLLFGIVMLTTAAALNAAFALWANRNGDRFQPMHVFSRGTYQAGHASQIAVVLLSTAALAWAFLRMRNSAAQWLLGMWLLMSALFIPEAIKEFALLRYDWRWEGSTYFTFALPLLTAALALQLPHTHVFFKNTQKHERQ